MKTVFEQVIQRGTYDLTGLLLNIDRYHVEGKLTDEERDDLYAQARACAVARYDYSTEIEELWAAVRALHANVSALQTAQGAGGEQTGDEPADEWPAYVQPTGAHDAYQVGAQVTYNGAHYVCALANCIWSPDVHPAGWTAQA